MNKLLTENTFVCVLVTRRGEILVVRDDLGYCELPGRIGLAGESPSIVLASIASKLTNSGLGSVGGGISLDTGKTRSICYPILTKRSSFENWASLESNLEWISKSDCVGGNAKCAPALAALIPNFPDDAGNDYAIGETSKGVATFFHLATGETLHGQVGPWEEAQNLYLPLSRLENRIGRAVVHDLGLGCGTLALCVLDAFLRNRGLSDIEILSYDLETKGIVALLDNIESFPFAAPFRAALEEFVERGETVFATPDGRKAVWRFCAGDFVVTSTRLLPEEQKANVIFLDFFSPKSAPELWTYKVAKRIFANAAEDAILITSSGATSSRAVLAAAGFFVGLAPASGKRSHSTVAAKRLCDLEFPLPKKWLQTFLISHVPFCSAEDDSSKEIIRGCIEKHAQFKS